MYAPRRSGEVERVRAADPKRPPAARVDVLVALQQAGGNQAVTRMLGARTAPRPVLARYGVRVVTDPAAAAPVITDIHVIGRPKLRLIAGAEGSHVTAWAVFADIVRRAIVGLQTGPALVAAKQLLRDQVAALRAAWANPYPAPVTAGLADAATAIEDLPGADDGAKLSQLQEVIGAYLTLHNLRPGTAVLIGKAQAIGAGEPAHLSTLREHEVTGAGDATALHTAFFGLMDARALAFIGNLHAPSGAAPGVDAADPQRVGRSVLRGLEDLAAAYPSSYASVVVNPGVVTLWLHSKGLPTALPGAVPAAVQAAAAPAGWSRIGQAAGQEVNKRSALCQIVLEHPEARMGLEDDDDEEPPEPVVGELRLAGRPPTLTKREQGHHTVAWKLEMLRLQTLLVGRTLSVAARRLVHIAEDLHNELETGLEWLADEELDDDSDEEFRTYSRWALSSSRDVLRAQIDSINPDGADTFVVLLAAQDLASAWMNGVNVLPLGAAEIGAPANSRGEGTAIANLRKYQLPAPQLKRGRDVYEYGPKEARTDLMRLLDVKAVEYLHVADPAGLAYPGDMDHRVVVILRRFLRAAWTVFPKAVRDSGIATPEGVAKLVNGLRTSVDDLDAVVRAVLFLDAEDDGGPELDFSDEDVSDEEQEVQPPPTKKLKLIISAGGVRLG